jgi:hypothetical protein
LDFVLISNKFDTEEKLSENIVAGEFAFLLRVTNNLLLKTGRNQNELRKQQGRLKA